MVPNRQHGGHGTPSPRGVIRRVQDMLGTEVCTLKTYLGHDVNWAQRPLSECLFFSIQKNGQWIWGPGHDPSQITASLWNYSSIQIVHWAVFNFRGFLQFHLPTIFEKTTCISFSTSKSKDAKAARFLPMDNSNSAFPVPKNKDDRPLKDLVPSLPMGKRGQDWITVHQKTYNTAHYTPPLEALKYAHSKTDFTLCAGGVDEVNYPFNDSMANSLIATKPISLSPSIA